jgi:ATP-dependent phosphofructokinase / diphosphate-dependent phosphofructokinase
MAGKHLGVLTGGGDVPGLNAAIKAVYTATKDRGWLRPGSSDAHVTGIRRGWKGALGLADDLADGGASHSIPLTDELVRTIDRSGGTFLHSSRTKPDRMAIASLPDALVRRKGELPRVGAEGAGLVDTTDAVIANLTALGIDCLVAIGGDDTLSYAHTLHTRGFPVVGIPKTMDNDIRSTEYAIGFATALDRAVNFIENQRTHLGSHETIGVFRVFGRDAGFTALGTAMSISDLRCAIPEHPFDLDALCELLRRDQTGNPSRYAMVVCSEGAIWKGGTLGEVGETDAFGHRHKQNVGEALVDEISRRTGLPARTQDLTYDLRSGSPVPVDRIVANTYGVLAVDLIAQEKTGMMVCIQNGLYGHAKLPAAAAGPRKVNVASDYDVARFRPRFESRLGKSLFL